MIDSFRRRLRSLKLWTKVRELQRDGLRTHWHRSRIGPRILSTAPVTTLPPNSDSPCEVHILTWQKDYLSALWTAKSFYTFANVDWPLIWHQGGALNATARQQLLEHFPQSLFVPQQDADIAVGKALQDRNLPRCQEGRRISFMLKKLLDVLVLSRAAHLLIVDSDVLFFRRPVEILDAVAGDTPRSHYNRDAKNYYNLTPEAVRVRYGLELVERLNAGLGLICRRAAPLEAIEEFLGDPDIYAEPWLTEQTMHALLGSRFGVEILPPTYACTIQAGLTAPDGTPLVAKHYPSNPRPLLHQEGMRHLIATGFLETIPCRA